MNEFVRVFNSQFGVTATPRLRQGIDIDARCGQLKAVVQKKEQEQLEVESENAMLKLKNVPNEHELASFVSKSEPGQSATG